MQPQAQKTPHRRHSKTSTASPRWARSTPTSAHATGRDGQRGAAPTTSPQPKPFLALQEPPPPRSPPSPPPFVLAVRVRRGASDGGCARPRRGCWRELAACVGGCGGGQMGLGMGGHTRTNGLLTGAAGERMFVSNFRSATWRGPRQAPAAGGYKSLNGAGRG